MQIAGAQLDALGEQAVLADRDVRLGDDLTCLASNRSPIRTVTPRPRTTISPQISTSSPISTRLSRP